MSDHSDASSSSGDDHDNNNNNCRNEEEEEEEEESLFENLSPEESYILRQFIESEPYQKAIEAFTPEGVEDLFHQVSKWSDWNQTYDVYSITEQKEQLVSIIAMLPRDEYIQNIRNQVEGERSEILEHPIMIPSSCWHCRRRGGGQLILCLGCMAVGYCSEQCLVFSTFFLFFFLWDEFLVKTCDTDSEEREKGREDSWRKGSEWRQGEKHQDYCASYRKQMNRALDSEELGLQFPWFELGIDGTFHDAFVMAKNHVLGDSHFGYWCKRFKGRRLAHVPQEENNDNPYRRVSLVGKIYNLVEKQGVRGYRHGYMYYRSKHLDENDAWHGIPRELRANHRFGKDDPMMPEKLLDKRLRSWKEWYEWRKLPMKSIMSLVMHRALSVYEMIHVLGLYETAEQVDGRKQICLHLLDLKTELNSVGTFAELALLFPKTDIHMVLFGKHEYRLYHTAPEGSIARTGCLLQYKAPEQLGGGTVIVDIETRSNHWRQDLLITMDSPQALMSFNTNLWESDDWKHLRPICEYSILNEVPFIMTDYGEMTIEGGKERLVELMGDLQAEKSTPAFEKKAESMMRDMDECFLSVWNPFQRPGQRRTTMSKLPSMANGFIFRI